MKLNKSNLWEETDGYTNKYNCVLSLCLVTIVSPTMYKNIYKNIGSTGHIKYVVDGPNAIDKCFERENEQVIKNIT